MTRALAGLLCVCALGCGENAAISVRHVQQAHTSALVADGTGMRLFVAHPDADSVSIVDLGERQVVAEQLLAKQAPARDDAQRYEPAVGPRALALSKAGDRLYVTGQRSGRVYALDATSLTVLVEVPVCAEPVGVLVSADDQNVFVACAQDDEIVELAADDLSTVARVPCPRKPWALAWQADGKTLLATHFLGAGVSSFATDPLALQSTWTLAPGPFVTNEIAPKQDADPTEPHGQVRGLYDALLRPGTSELWVAHLMLGTDTPQPQLDFNNTVFPALSILDVDGAGAQLARLSISAHADDGGAFGDVVSGPHALAFSEDGKYAFVADTNSEDVLVVDAEQRVEARLVRPLPGHLPEALVVTGNKLIVLERNSEDVALFDIGFGADGIVLTQAGAAIATLRTDPMPAELRLGQKMFYSSNSDDLPLTQNHWVACASCHLEGRSDAVTWLFNQGPRDTPTNAGGLLDTGFLFRTADRTRVQDYWATINLEQGGHFSADEPSQQPLLDALAEFVNYAIPTPVAPTVAATHDLDADALSQLRMRGEQVFTREHCDRCHFGPAKTDSGAGNPDLDLSGAVVSAQSDGAVLLHDVGTCVNRGAAPDVAHPDIQGDMRDGCAFDTPQLRGLADSAPYLHDGSAATLTDVLPIMLKASAAPGGPVTQLSDDDQTALVEYLRSL